MAKTTPFRAQQCASFLRALSTGASVSEAAKAGRILWNTLYRWRRDDSRFRAAWDDAARAGEDAKAAKLDEALMRRAVDGIDEPVFHAGEEVGTRKRYSDPLLMFGIRELRQRRAARRPFIAHTPLVTVVIEPLEEDDEPVSAKTLENKNE
jgi:transposase-like protein